MEENTNELLASLPTQPSFYNLTPEFAKIPPKSNQFIQNISKPHIESFNAAIREYFPNSLKFLHPVEFELPSGLRISLEINDIKIDHPKNSAERNSKSLLPSECRLRGTTYKGRLTIEFVWTIDGEPQLNCNPVVGEVPVMVRSSACNLNGMSPEELVKCGEEEEEFGGYFIINGNEKILRMLIVQRRNFPLVLKRSSWKNRGKRFSDIGISIRCVRADETVSNMVLHYLTNGSVMVMIIYKREMFFIPIVLLLKALICYADREIFSRLVRQYENDNFYKGCIANMLLEVQEQKLMSRNQILNYIGKHFRSKVNLPEWYTDREVAEYLLQCCVCAHLNSNEDKFNLLVYMTQKLFAAAHGKCRIESEDSLMNQEILLPGQIYSNALKEKLQVWLAFMRTIILRKANAVGPSFKLNTSNMSNFLSLGLDIGKTMENFLATGNIRATYDYLPQDKGLSVPAEKLNFHRYISHFRSVHRGNFFATLRTTTVRKLLPEFWGFICPVHTPDGAPCGLLNHLTTACEVATDSASPNLIQVIFSLGVTSINAPPPDICSNCYSVILDGQIIGWVTKDKAQEFVEKMRHKKLSGDIKVSPYLEIGLLPITGKASPYPGIFLFSTNGRLLRPVKSLYANKVEYIGTFEQVYMNISVGPWEITDKTTHQELKETNILSILASLIPLSDFNQSPRNMYQCQMAKQTMGTAMHSLKRRSDGKIYRILTPQAPLFRPVVYDLYNMDKYPSGTNAIVAVVSYTGYDMEDAMILNKASYERGFAHGVIYKSEFIDLAKDYKERSGFLVFGLGADVNESFKEKLGPDGLPHVGVLLNQKDPFYSIIDLTTNIAEIKYFKSAESAYVEDVMVVMHESSGQKIFQKVCIKLRIPRNPIVGDKFASRHGQKGICSQLWKQEDMPFTESGMTPDIIFNPHGFPSRMTIGMMIETMAGKSGALHGLVHDATPFKFSEDDPAADYFGKLLTDAGYNYYGNEIMYSGVDGREMEVEIFFGVVYYQRLRHMVSDKFQVRTTGPMDSLTGQPVKGRKRGGGIRFGEMERDALIAHGVSFLLQDRLFTCSDKTMEYACCKCGSLLSPVGSLKITGNSDHKPTCSVCESKLNIQKIWLPSVFRYLVAELAAVNIKVVLHIE